MTSTPAIARCIACILLPIVSACASSRDAVVVPAIDLIRRLDRAEKRPAAGFEVSTHDVGGMSHPSILAPVPSRLMWPLTIPQRAVLRAFVAAEHKAPDGPAAPVRLRIGISDHRIYEGLVDAIVAPGESRWTELRADLSSYAGWKWSLFYRPDRVTWRIVLAADAMGTGRSRAVWGTPQILADSESAREHSKRSAQNLELGARDTGPVFY